MISDRLFVSMDDFSVYFMRYYLRLAHGGSVEQRQARHRHPSDFHPWDYRYNKSIYHGRHIALI
jgi:hypothetical protein